MELHQSCFLRYEERACTSICLRLLEVCESHSIIRRVVGFLEGRIDSAAVMSQDIICVTIILRYCQRSADQ